MGSTCSGDPGRIAIGRMGCARAFVGSARPASAQRPAGRYSVVGHAEDRRAGGASSAIVVCALGAGSSAPAAAAAIRAPTTGRGAVLVATGRISRSADLSRAGCGRPARAGNGRPATATTGGGPSRPSTVAAARSRNAATTSTASAGSAGSGSGCR